MQSWLSPNPGFTAQDSICITNRSAQERELRAAPSGFLPTCKCRFTSVLYSSVKFCLQYFVSLFTNLAWTPATIKEENLHVFTVRQVIFVHFPQRPGPGRQSQAHRPGGRGHHLLENCLSGWCSFLFGFGHRMQSAKEHTQPLPPPSLRAAHLPRLLPTPLPRGGTCLASVRLALMPRTLEFRCFCVKVTDKWFCTRAGGFLLILPR